MKIPVVIMFMLLSPKLFAQQLNGFVFDKTTGKPIPNASVKKEHTVQLSAYDGYFSLNSAHFGDTVKINSMGYKPKVLIMGMRNPDTLRVYLEETSIMLNNVTVNSKRDTKLDSANVRKEFAKIFAYKAPTIKDAFLTIDPYVYKPNNYITSQQSTAAIVGVDLLSIVSLFGKNNAPDSKLHELALQDEKIKYIDQRFSTRRVSSITNLQGDDLADFMIQYRPEIEDLKKMSDYDVMVYIKKCYANYLKAGKRNEKLGIDN